MKLSRVPQCVDLNELGASIAADIEEYRKNVGSMTDLSESLGVHLSSISKALAEWPTKRSKIYATNKLLVECLSFYIENYLNEQDRFVRILKKNPFVNQVHDFLRQGPVETDPKIGTQSDYDNVTNFAYQTIYQILNVTHADSERVLTDFKGKYLCARNSRIEGRIVVSVIRIRPRMGVEGVWEYLHDRKDSSGHDIKSDGVVVPMSQNIYMISDIERGRGIEFMVFEEPFSRSFSDLFGLNITVGLDRRPVSSRFGLIREERVIDLFQGNYSLLNLIGAYDRKVFCENYMELEEFITKACNDTSLKNRARSISDE